MGFMILSSFFFVLKFCHANSLHERSVYDPATFIMAFEYLGKQETVVSNVRIEQPFQFISLPLVNACLHLLKSGMQAVHLSSPTYMKPLVHLTVDLLPEILSS